MKIDIKQIVMNESYVIAVDNNGQVWRRSVSPRAPWYQDGELPDDPLQRGEAPSNKEAASIEQAKPADHTAKS